MIETKKKMEPSTTVYKPDKSLQHGTGFLAREITREIVENRWLTYQLFYRDFTTVYKQSIAGILWMFILPVANVATFLMLNRSGIFNFGEIPVPYPVYAILGMAFWQIFASGIVAAGNSLTQMGETLTRINMPKKCLVLASMGRCLMAFAVQLGLLTILCLVYKITPHPNFFAFAIVMLPIIILTLGMGFFIAILNAIIRDAGNLLNMGVMFLLYLTPVLYARPAQGFLAQATTYNPMYYFISAGRDLFLTGTIQELNGFLISTAASCILLIISLYIFHMTETRIAERI
jgi:lipopolysaccharide transport system permease protein